MSIRVFARRNFEGQDIVGFDAKNLQQLSQPMRPTSVRMTDGDDRLLFLTRPDWQGQAMFLHGTKAVSHLGQPGEGGKVGFGNTISSMRVTPFRVRLRFHVITDRDPNVVFPGNLDSGLEAQQFIQDAVQRAAEIWKPHLVDVELESIETPEDVSQFFDLNDEFWKVIVAGRRFDGLKAGANILLVNSLGGSTTGTAINHKLSRRIALVAVVSAVSAGHTLAHELGHFFGLGLHSDDPNNLMKSGGSGTALTDGQVERAHENLARGSGLDRGIRIE